MLRSIVHSLTFRLSLMFSMCALVVLLSLGFVVLYAVNQHFISQDKIALDSQSHHIIQTLNQSTDLSALQKKMQPLHQTNQHNDHDFFILITNMAHQIVFQHNPNHLIFNPDHIVTTTTQPLLQVWHTENISYRVLTQPIEVANKPMILTVAININHHELFLASFQYSMWLSIAIAVLLMGVLACLVTKRGLKPLHTLVNQTAQITANNLSQRLPITNNDTEIAQLTRTFNEMLNRLDVSFQRLTGFSSDLAHELRTPLSTMKMQYQVLLSRSRTLDEYKKALQDNAEELDHLITMVTDMLFLAKSENGLIQTVPQSFSLLDDINTLCAFYEYLAEEKNMRLHVTGSAQITGDKTLLRRAISNLIANAITYGYPNTAINIEIKQHLQHIMITIENHSDTIEPSHLAHLFDRFYRIDSARTLSSEGFGLGLAITKAIIAAHQGNITVASKDNVTCFVIMLPTSDMT